MTIEELDILSEAQATIRSVAVQTHRRALRVLDSPDPVSPVTRNLLIVWSRQLSAIADDINAQTAITSR